MALSWSYVAGFFDGEGCIRMAMGSGCHSTQFSLHQSGERGRLLLEEIKQFFAEHGINCSVARHQPGKGAQKVMYRLYCYNREGVMTFIKHAFPYLHIKKVECQDLWRYAVMFPMKRRTRVFKGEIVRVSCSKGHDLRGTNAFMHNGVRECRACRSAYRLEIYQKIVQVVMKGTGLTRREVMAELPMWKAAAAAGDLQVAMAERVRRYL